ncbi:NAD(P)H-hydrate dehydratase [Sphingomonas sp. KR1UV-12]|uniref:Bifunctional NAD(P)H-hydrate repair enzyme n=1 Tax=Sphingomonas aurea TaxID=3063994 RepID=A0ABT9EHF1_9SPHN|nr:NAD(P)H-hydrate dehydratase [Sphingomonas sp. KR1UV-12]MDP1026344.1 NAD(P)H-hydrate dehydratase [Sphingomonas sp. KR1UV-12]
MSPITGTPILTAAEMRSAEAAHGDSAFLMEQAGQGIAGAIRRLVAGAEVLILCGPGNNGGDGYVAARLLREQGHAVRIAAAGEPKSDLARAARTRWDGPVEPLAEAQPAPVLVDALFGTGLSRPLPDGVATDLHRLAEAARFRVAIDLPSGVASDDGCCLSMVPRFDLTLALGSAKPAHLLYPAAGLMGEVRLIDLGLAPVSRASVMRRADLPEPGPASHKYSRGMVAVVAGRMGGAAELAAVSALRAGAGYVLHLGGRDPKGAPHAVVRRRWSAEALDDVRIGAVVIGPGLGRDDDARARLDAVLASGRPLVIDGDALHLLDPDAPRGAPAILTPHQGEFDALFGKGEGSRIDRARAAAARSGATVVLKGPDTVIADPDGRVIVATGGSPWLSTAGTGDVLAGATGAMLSAGLSPFDAATAAVRLHGRAAVACGRSFIADDLAAALSRVR